VAAVLTIDTPERRSYYRPLLVAATLLAFCVVGLGAYVRLSDAGLGCPDWPGCYGHLVGVPDTHAEHAAAATAFPGKPVETGKAWKEMIHRYAAGTLGLLILGIALSAWADWRRERERRPWLETGLLGLVTFQALLGMWTVTLLLKPVIVTAHLLGGMATLSLLVLCLVRDAKVGSRRTAMPDAVTRLLGLLALATVLGQIALGGWVSSNYAALACADFPTCQSSWWPAADYANAFHLTRELGQTAEGGLLPFAALTAIHWTHRLGALLVFCVVGAYAMRLLKRRNRVGLLLVVLLAVQVGLGIANVLLSLPLAVAVAHNLGAALLLATLVVANFRRN
jgi:cytochrome c oxidase assembly protein subunit 15